MIRHCLRIITILMIISGCRTKTNQDPVTIKIDPGKFIPINLDTLLTYSTITSLEYTPEALLSEGGRVALTPDGFFISNYREPVYQFDTAGNFVQRIGAIGEGPGEYISCREKVINPDGFALLTMEGPTKILFYNRTGTYLKSSRIFEEGISDFARHPKTGDYYLFSTMLPDVIQRVDPATMTVKSSFLKSDEPPHGSLYSSFYTTCEGKLLFRDPGRQRIYEIAEDSAYLRYKFDYGSHYPDPASLTWEERIKLTNQEESWRIYTFLENASWIYVMVRNQNINLTREAEFHHLLIRKSDHALFRLPGSLKNRELFYPDGFWLDQNNILYIPIPPAFLMEQAKWIQYLKEKGIEYNPDGNWLIVKIPLDRMV